MNEPGTYLRNQKNFIRESVHLLPLDGVLLQYFAMNSTSRDRKTGQGRGGLQGRLGGAWPAKGHWWPAGGKLAASREASKAAGSRPSMLARGQTVAADLAAQGCRGQHGRPEKLLAWPGKALAG